MSPTTVLGRNVLTPSTRFLSLIAHCTRYFPSATNETALIRPLPCSFRSVAIGLAPGASAALRQPCGVSQISSCRCSPSAGCGATLVPSTFQAQFSLPSPFGCGPPLSGVVMAGALPPPIGPPSPAPLVVSPYSSREDRAS